MLLYSCTVIYYSIFTRVSLFCFLSETELEALLALVTDMKEKGTTLKPPMRMATNPCPITLRRHFISEYLRADALPSY